MVSTLAKRIVFPFIAVILIYSCAKIGVPSGGPKDVTPPKVVESVPAMNATDFKGKRIEITFDEFIQLIDIQKNFVISPPMKKKPSILMRNKSVIITPEESLKPNCTYRLFFGNAIVDNNEKNPLKNYEFVFSTGDKIDSLSLRGRVVDAFDHKPEAKESFFVMLYSKFQDTVPRRQLPEYITKTDEKGFFSITHIRPDTFMIFALKDLNQNYLFDQPNEPIAFSDTLIPIDNRYYIPDSLVKPDTLGLDSMNRAPFKTQIKLYSFTENHEKQYVKKEERANLEKFSLIFNLPVIDSLLMKPLNFSSKKWLLPDCSLRKDTMSYWITDTSLVYNDTLKLRLGYSALDSLEQNIIHKYDTISLVYKRPSVAKSKSKTPPPLKITKFSVACNAEGQSSFDLNAKVMFSPNHPLAYIDTSKISLIRIQDEKKTRMKFRIKRDSVYLRKYFVNFRLEPATDYQLVADSMAFRDIYGQYSDSLGCKFKSQKDDYYGKIKLKVSNVKEQMIIQLLTEKGDVVRQQIINKDQEVIFDFLHPDKYKLKAIYDTNHNGVWDTGSFARQCQPEKVTFYTKEIPVRSNWDMDESWILE